MWHFCSVEDIRLCETVKHGVGFHHAGLSLKDRDGIEQLYRAGIIRVLVSTSTLAFGINLPSHTVIIKSTEVKTIFFLIILAQN